MYGQMKEHLQKEITSIKEQGLFKQERIITTPQSAKIKVAGGVDTFAEAMALINAGAARIGTSKAVEIITS